MWLRVRIGGYKIFTAAANADANKSLKGGYWGIGNKNSGCMGILAILSILVLFGLILILTDC